MEKIIDIHGAHVLDFERYSLEQGDIEQSKKLGYPVLECIKDIETFLGRNSKNLITILPSPTPIYNHENKKSMSFDIFPFYYENMQLIQVMTFAEKLGLKDRIIPFFGVSPKEKSRGYSKFLRRITDSIKCGFKFHPLAMQIPASDLENSLAMNIAVEREIPFLIHTTKDQYSNSEQVLNLAKKYPEINICAAHFGHFNKKFLKNVSKIKNLYLDTSILSALLNEISNDNSSYLDLNAVPEDIKKSKKDKIFNWIVDHYQLEDKIMFGTDLKWTSKVGTSREKEINLAKNLNYLQDKKTKWLYENAKSFLRL